MKSNRITTLIVVALMAGLLGLLYWISTHPRGKYDWNESWSQNAYSPESKEPYGLRIAKRLMEGYFPGKKMSVIDEKLGDQLDSTATGANYVFVGGSMYFDSTDLRRLLDFVYRGNTALLSAKTLPAELMESLYPEACEEGYWSDLLSESDSTVHLAFYDMELPDSNGATCSYVRRNMTQGYEWHFIPYYIFCDSQPQRPLGVLNDTLVNFAAFPFGKGRFLLHSTPLALTNFNLLRPDGQAYAEALFSFLRSGNIYWDDSSRSPEAIGRRRNERYGQGRMLDSEHPLLYVMRNPPLRWAWYLLLGMGFIFLIFRSKRRERAIPVLPKNSNTSLEFIETIANLHFNERNFERLCSRKMKLFLAHVRERYSLQPPHHPDTMQPAVDTVFIKRLSEVSEVPELAIQSIFTQYTFIANNQPTEEMAIQFHLALEHFLKNAK